MEKQIIYEIQIENSCKLSSSLGQFADTGNFVFNSKSDFPRGRSKNLKLVNPCTGEVFAESDKDQIPDYILIAFVNFHKSGHTATNVIGESIDSMTLF